MDLVVFAACKRADRSRRRVRLELQELALRFEELDFALQQLALALCYSTKHE